MDMIECKEYFMLISKLTLQHDERSICFQASFQIPLPKWITEINEKEVEILSYKEKNRGREGGNEKSFHNIMI